MENPLKDMDFTTIKAGDVLVVRPKRDITMHEVEMMRAACKEALDTMDIRMIVMPHDMEVSILTPDAEA